MEANYITVDNVQIFEGDSFYYLEKNLGTYTYSIKYWNAKVMDTLKLNSFYLDGKLMFSNLEVLKNHIDTNELVTVNYKLIFK